MPHPPPDAVRLGLSRPQPLPRPPPPALPRRAWIPAASLWRAFPWRPLSHAIAVHGFRAASTRSVGHLLRRVKSYGPRPGKSPRESFQYLIKTKDVYDVAPQIVRPFEWDRVAVLRGAFTPSLLRPRLPDNAAAFLDDYEHRVMRTELARATAVSSSRPTRHSRWPVSARRSSTSEPCAALAWSGSAITSTSCTRAASPRCRGPADRTGGCRRRCRASSRPTC